MHALAQALTHSSGRLSENALTFKEMKTVGLAASHLTYCQFNKSFSVLIADSSAWDGAFIFVGVVS
jgi:hypothetical protein